MELDVFNIERRPGEFNQLPACGAIPDSSQVVSPAGYNLSAIRAKSNRVGSQLVSLEMQDRMSGREVPNIDIVIKVTGKNGFPIGAEIQFPNHLSAGFDSLHQFKAACIPYIDSIVQPPGCQA